MQDLNKRKITLEEVKNLPTVEKNKLVSENVTQSTLHFAKRTDKLMSILNKGGMFKHGEIEYKVDSYFYRVEFQARGAPHIHCLLWLEDDNNKKPPSMWNEDSKTNVNLGQEIASFCGAIMSGSATEMNCDNHDTFNFDFVECMDGENLVEKLPIP